MHARRKRAWARRWDSYPRLRSYVGLRKGVRRLGVSRCLTKGTPLTKAFQNWIGEAPRSRKKDGAKPVVAADKGSYRHSFPDCGVFPWSIAKYLASGPAASTVEWSIELLNCSRNLLLGRVEVLPLSFCCSEVDFGPVLGKGFGLPVRMKGFRCPVFKRDPFAYACR